jgi:nucleotide-binding universal stress UspA family protein
MKEIRSILFPTDFSAVANSAFSLAVTLAARFEAAIHALHITGGGDPHITDSSRYEFPRLPAGTPPQVQLKEAVVQKTDEDPSEIIMREARGRECDLIVMASHGRSDVAQFFLGRSVAERVARDSSIPTIIVRLYGPRRTTRPIDRFARIIYATDLAEHTRGILPTAASIAHRTGAQITALCVFDEGDVQPADGGRATLQKFFAEAGVREASWGCETVRGGVAEAVVEYAESNEVDLIATTTALCSGGDPEMTATAEFIIRNAPCPVLCVRTDIKS